MQNFFVMGGKAKNEARPMKPLPEILTAKLHAWLGDQDEFVFLDCARPSGEEHRSLLFTGPVQWITCTEPGQAGAFLAEADDLRSRGYYLAGWFSYEFGYLH